MHRIRVYVDTSVFGGTQDEEFFVESSDFFDQVRIGKTRNSPFPILPIRDMPPRPPAARRASTSRPRDHSSRSSQVAMHQPIHLRRSAGGVAQEELADYPPLPIRDTPPGRRRGRPRRRGPPAPPTPARRAAGQGSRSPEACRGCTA